MTITPLARRRLRGASKSRLAYLGAALAVAGLIQANIDVFGEFLTPRWQGLLTLAVGVAIIVLRAGTRLPLEDR